MDQLFAKQFATGAQASTGEQHHDGNQVYYVYMYMKYKPFYAVIESTLSLGQHTDGGSQFEEDYDHQKETEDQDEEQSQSQAAASIANDSF